MRVGWRGEVGREVGSSLAVLGSQTAAACTVVAAPVYVVDVVAAVDVVDVVDVAAEKTAAGAVGGEGTELAYTALAPRPRVSQDW